MLASGREAREECVLQASAGDRHRRMRLMAQDTHLARMLLRFGSFAASAPVTGKGGCMSHRMGTVVIPLIVSHSNRPRCFAERAPQGGAVFALGWSWCCVEHVSSDRRCAPRCTGLVWLMHSAAKRVWHGGGGNMESECHGGSVKHKIFIFARKYFPAKLCLAEYAWVSHAIFDNVTCIYP